MMHMHRAKDSHVVTGGLSVWMQCLLFVFAVRCEMVISVVGFRSSFGMCYSR